MTRANRLIGDSPTSILSPVRRADDATGMIYVNASPITVILSRRYSRRACRKAWPGMTTRCTSNSTPLISIPAKPLILYTDGSSTP